MRSVWIFRLFALLVFGSLFAIGIIFFMDQPEKLWVIEILAAAALIFFILLYRRLVRPYNLIMTGIELINEQDFSTRLRRVSNREADKIIEVFNRMITQLKEERLEVREKNQLLDLLTEASPQGLLILDLDRCISDINPAGLQLLDIKEPGAVIGRTLSEAGFELAGKLAELEKGETAVIRTPGQSIYRCTMSSFVDHGFDHPFILVEELSHELRRIEKQSYETIIRMMSHEVNNSVAAIGATLNVVSDILGNDGEKDWTDVLPAVDASFERCGNLARFTRNLAELIKVPEPSLSDTSIDKLADTAVRLAAADCMRRNIRLDYLPGGGNGTVKADPIQFEQVLLNIIKNSCEAIGNGGEITVCTTPASITIEDNGPGLDPAASDKLFTPFYSTKPDGQGIGLMFVKEVLSNHGCRFSLGTTDGRTVFRIQFPE